MRALPTKTQLDGAVCSGRGDFHIETSGVVVDIEDLEYAHVQDT